jgi:hypothetical protein
LPLLNGTNSNCYLRRHINPKIGIKIIFITLIKAYKHWNKNSTATTKKLVPTKPETAANSESVRICAMPQSDICCNKT